MQFAAVSREKNIHVLIAVGCCFGLATRACADSSVALVTSSQLASAQATVELATIKLAEDEEISVVDRQAIEQVLQEQQLTLKGVASGERAIALGRLLEVDIFAVYLPAKEDARLIVFETALGVRLLDENLDQAGDNINVSKIVDSVRSTLTKREALSKQGLRFISFHGYRNVDLETSWSPWVEEARRDLEQSFSNMDGVAVLERAQLRYINIERMLPQTQIQASLLASAVNLVVQFSRSKQPDSATVTLLVSLPGQSEPKTFSTVVPRVESSDELGKLALEVSQVVAADGKWYRSSQEPSSKLQVRQREAGRLRSEARRLFARDEWHDAAVFSEATCAMAPENYRDLAYLAFTLDYYAEDLLETLNNSKPTTPYKQGAAEVKLLKAIEILDYRLNLIAQLHEHRKHEADWHMLMIKHGGEFPPWHRGVDELGKLLKQSTNLNVQPAKKHLQQFYDLWFGTIVRYKQQRVRSADEARRVISETYHQGRAYLRDVARSQEKWPELFLEQYDGWAKVLRERGWNRDRPGDIAAINALLRLLEFHKYDRYDMSDDQLDMLISRWETFANHPSKKISHRSCYQVASIRVERLAKSTPSRAELNAKIDQFVEELAMPILTELSKDLPAPSEADIGPLGVLSQAMMPVRFDKRITQLAAKLGVVCTLYPDFDRRKTACRARFDECMELDIFSPSLFYSSLPRHSSVRDDSSIGPKDLSQRIAFYEETLTQLHRSRGKRSTPEIEKVILALESELRDNQSTLAKLEANAYGESALESKLGIVTPWSQLTLLAGKPGLPKKWNDPSWPRILGFSHDDRNVYYLLQHSRSANTSESSVSAYRVPLAKPSNSIRLNSATVKGRYIDLTNEQKEHCGKIASAHWEANPNPVAIDKEFLYINRIARGILVLPLDGGDPFTLNEQSGLPSNYVHTIAPANGKLYAWVGRPRKENILVEVTPATRTTRVLASSERVEVMNELDDRRPTTTKLMIFDAPRNRLVFWFRSQVWAWDLETDEPSKLLDVPWKKDHWLRNVIPLPHREALLINRSMDYWLLNLSNDSLEKFPFPNTSSNGLGPPTLLLDQKVWLRRPWSVYDLASHTRHELRLPLSDQLPPPMYWAPWCEVVGDGNQCLIWDQYHLWLAELNNGDKTRKMINKDVFRIKLPE